MALSGEYDDDVLAGSVRSAKQSGPVSYWKLCYNVLIKDLIAMWFIP